MAAALFASAADSGMAQSTGNVTPLDLFVAAWDRVNESFFDPKFNGVDWDEARRRYEPRAASARSVEEAAAIVKEMLDELGTSHTGMFLPGDLEFYFLLDVFNFGPFAEQVQRIFPDGEVTYPGVGLLTEEIGGGHFVRGVLEGSPADQVGIEVGDRIVSVDGSTFRPVFSFAGKEGRQVLVRIQRSRDVNDVVDLGIRPIRIRPGEIFLEAMRNSVRVFTVDGVEVGYIHIWSYGGAQYQELLEREVAFGLLSSADVMIMDLREGLGGANPNYLNLFNRNVPRLTRVTRDGRTQQFDTQWRKPVVLLVNEGTRSGKEILAFGFKAYGIGPVVGTRTAGAVVGGSPFLLPGDVLLYLAVQDVFVNGERVEGRGVRPDVEVFFTLPYARGEDPQFERAVEVAVAEVRRARR